MSGFGAGVGTAWIDIRPNLSGFHSDVQTGVTGALGGVGKLVAGAFAVGAVVNFGKSVLDVGSNFEKSLSAVKAVTGSTNQEMESLRQKALQLGSDTVFSASESANAIGELAKAGVPVEGILGGAADAAVALAAAGGIALPEAAQIASNAMNQFSLSAQQLPKVADLIAGAANASAIDVNDFGLSLQQVGAVARTVGLSFDDTAVAIAALGKAGIVGSDAGTSLKTMLLNLQPQTKKQITLAKQLGIVTADGANQFFDASGKAKSLAQISGVLQKALAGQTDQQKLATLEILFGTDAIRAAAVLSREGAAGITEMATAMGKVTAEGVAATRLDNFAGSVEKLKGSYESFILTATGSDLGVARDAVDRLTELLDAATKAVGEGGLTGALKAVYGELSLGTQIVIGFAGAIGGVLAANQAAGAVLGLRDAVSNLGSIGSSATGNISQLFSLFESAPTAAQQRIQALTEASGALDTKMSAIKQRMTDLGNAGVQAALNRDQLAAQAFKEELQKLDKQLQDMTDKKYTIDVEKKYLEAGDESKASEAGKKAGSGLLSGFAGAIGGGIAGAVASAFSGSAILGALGTAASAIGAVIFSVPALIVAAVAAAGFVVYAFRDEIWRFLTATLPEALRSAWDFAINFLLSTLPEMLRKVPDLLRTFFVDTLPSLIGQGIGMAIGYALVAIGTLIGLIIKALTEGIPALLGALLNIGSTIVGAIVGALGDALGFVVGLVVRIATALHEGFVSAVTATVGFFRRLPGYIVDILTTVFNAVKDFAIGMVTDPIGTLEGLVTGIQDLFGRILSFALEIGAKILSAVVDAFSSVARKAKEIWDGIVDFLSGIFSNMVENVKSAMGNFLGGIVDGLAKVNEQTGGKLKEWVDKIRDFVGDAVDKVKEFPGKVLSAIGNLGSTLFNSGKSLIQGLIDGAGSLLGRIGQFFLEKLPGWIVGPFKSALGIKSPSTVFRGLGKNIGLGLVEGMESTTGLISDAADAMAAATLFDLAPISLPAVEYGGGSSRASAKASSDDAMTKTERHYHLTVNGSFDSVATVEEQFRRMERLALPV